MNITPPTPHPDYFRPEHRKLESMPHAAPAMEIKLFGKYLRVRDLLFPAFWIVAIGGVIIIVVFSWVYRQPAVQAFMVAYPGVPLHSPVQPGYSLLVRLTHLFNFFFLIFLVRSGINILLDHPRLYWTVHCTPGKEWLRWRGDVPPSKMWTSKDDSVTVPRWLGIPGGRHTLGISRHWHFLFDILFIVNGAIFIILQFALGEWQRLVPTSWQLFPQMVTCIIQYASLHDPSSIYKMNGYMRYDALQQLSYFAVVFILAPLQIMAGIAMSPGLANEHKWYQRLFGNRQAARSLHFLFMCAFVGFYIVHMIMVAYTGLRVNLNGITLNSNADGYMGFWLALLAIIGGVALTIWANNFSWRHPGILQKFSAKVISPIVDLFFDRNVNATYSSAKISPYFWANGKMPTSKEWQRLKANRWKDYRLKVDGLVENPVELSLDDLKALGKSEQVTMHNCIQGWSGIAEWGGLRFTKLIELVKPRPEVGYAIFYSYGEGLEGGQYYDSHTMKDLEHAMCLLAYEMNYDPLPDVHGAPLRLRVENQLGFKMVKWIKRIEFVEHYSDRFEGHGGYNEDHEFYGYRAEI